jgi:hypothetical protein
VTLKNVPNSLKFLWCAGKSEHVSLRPRLYFCLCLACTDACQQFELGSRPVDSKSWTNDVSSSVYAPPSVTGLEFAQACIPTPATTVPSSGPDWLHEIKHDGYRLIVQREGAGAAVSTGYCASSERLSVQDRQTFHATCVRRSCTSAAGLMGAWPTLTKYWRPMTR